MTTASCARGLQFWQLVVHVEQDGITLMSSLFLQANKGADDYDDSPSGCRWAGTLIIAMEWPCLLADKHQELELLSRRCI